MKEKIHLKAQKRINIIVTIDPFKALEHVLIMLSPLEISLIRHKSTIRKQLGSHKSGV